MQAIVTRDSAWTEPRKAPVVRVVDANSAQQLDLDEIGQDAIVDVRLRGTAWLLHTPKWRFSGAFESAPHQPWQITWRREHDQMTMVSGPRGARANRRESLPLSAGLGWVFIHPFVSTVSSDALFWTAMWLGSWFALLGWLMSPLGWTIRLGAGAIAVAGYILVNAAARMQMVPLEWAVEIAALVIGVAAARLLSHYVRE